MPFAMRAFPEAKLSLDSLPRSVECFFVIKYKADKLRAARQVKRTGEEPDRFKSEKREPTPGPGAYEVGRLAQKREERLLSLPAVFSISSSGIATVLTPAAPAAPEPPPAAGGAE